MILEERTLFQPGPHGSLKPGVRLNGTYEVEMLIAEGGMGEVYKGFNIQTGDPVAIKVMRPELSRSADAVALFRREASTLNTLHHDAIVRYYVFSVDTELQRAYLAMEYVDGPSLTDRISSAPLTSAELDVFRVRMGSALEAAHRLGIVHRDISSDNFILPGGEVARAKIIDFGIARSRRPGEATIIGDGFAGKYNYVSPEQLGLFGGETTPKSDIYSFGLVLAEAIRGQRIDMGGSQVEVIEKRRKTPDLSDIPASLRPLLLSMLQPNPADRLASMSAVVDWRAEPSPLLLRNSRNAAAPRTSSGGRVAAVVGALIVVGSLGALAYVFRGDLQNSIAPLIATTPVAQTPTPHPAQATIAPAPTPTPIVTLPPTPTPTQTVVVAATPSPSPEPAPANNVKVVTAEDLKEELPPRPPRPLLELPSATVGRPYRAVIPSFADPGGKGLQLTVDPEAPEGLALEDHGAGAYEFAGSPRKAGTTTFDIVAVDHRGRKARMSTKLVVAGAAVATSEPTPVPTLAPTPAPTLPPVRLVRPTQSAVALDGATVGRDYSVDLPPFTPGQDVHGLTLHAEPDPPAGLTFVDEGGGFSQISGKPTRAGSHTFEVVAADALGQSAKMNVRIVVAPAPAPAPPLQTAEAFLRAYEDGPCFLIRPGASGDHVATPEAIGVDMSAFLRFEAAYKRAIGANSQASFKPIASPQCPVLALLKMSAPGSDPRAEPHLDLTHFEIGGGSPLAGVVRGLAGRHLALLIVGEDGTVFRIPDTPTPGGDGAAFSEQLGRADASSIGPLQLLVAVASNQPLASLDKFRSGAIASLAPKLSAEWALAGASAEIGFFKLK